MPVLPEGSWGGEERKRRVVASWNAQGLMGGNRDASSSSHSSCCPLCFTCTSHPLQKVQSVFSSKVPILSHDPIAPDDALDGLSAGASWLTVVNACPPSSSVPTGGPALGGMARPSHGAAHTRKQRRHGRACAPGSSHHGHPALQGTAGGRRQSGCGRGAPSCPGGPCGSLSVG